MPVEFFKAQTLMHRNMQRLTYMYCRAWPKSSVRFFHHSVWKNPNTFFLASPIYTHTLNAHTCRTLKVKPPSRVRLLRPRDCNLSRLLRPWEFSSCGRMLEKAVGFPSGSSPPVNQTSISWQRTLFTICLIEKLLQILNRDVDETVMLIIYTLLDTHNSKYKLQDVSFTAPPSDFTRR